MEQKYVVFDDKHVVMFSGSLVHADVATMQHGAFEKNWERKVPTSAGFFSISSELSYESEDGSHWPEGRVVTEVTAYGESESLKIKSNPKRDSGLIRIALGIW